MKYLALIFMLLVGSANAQLVPPFQAKGRIGLGDWARPDAQAVFQNGPAGQGYPHNHALIEIGMDHNPCDPLEEGVIIFSGRAEDGAWKHLGTVSALWSGGCSYTTGYAVLRLISNTPTDYTDVAYRQWAGRGIGLFRSGDNDHCGGRFLCITRTSGYPSIAGKTDLTLEANHAGIPDKVLINSYNAGDVVLALGGGDVQWGQPVVQSGPTNPNTPVGWMRVKDRDGNLFWVQAYR